MVHGRTQDIWTYEHNIFPIIWLQIYTDTVETLKPGLKKKKDNNSKTKQIHLHMIRRQILQIKLTQVIKEKTLQEKTPNPELLQNIFSTSSFQFKKSRHINT